MTPKNPGPCPKCGFMNCDGFCQELGVAAMARDLAKCAGPSFIDPVARRPAAFKSIGAELRDQVAHPSHYTTGKIEVIDFILDQKLGYCLGNAIKYICRCNHKGNKTLDLQKAIQYLNFEIDKGGA